MASPANIAFYHNVFVDHVSSSPPHHQSLSASLTKLSKFSLKHLLELSTDIYDELVRRRKLRNPESSGYLPERGDIHPRRNYARRQIGGLSAGRLSDMCKDLIAEHERRFPDLAQVEKQDSHAPKKKSYDSDSSGPRADYDLDEEPEMRKVPSNEVEDPTELRIKSVAPTELVPNRSEMVESEDEDDIEDAADANKEELNDEDQTLVPPKKSHLRTVSKTDTITQLHQNYLPTSEDSFDGEASLVGDVSQDDTKSLHNDDESVFEFSEHQSPERLTKPRPWIQEDTGLQRPNDRSEPSRDDPNSIKASQSVATLATEYASAQGSLWSDTDGDSNNVLPNADSSIETSEDGHAHKLDEDILASPLATPRTNPGTPILVDKLPTESISDSVTPEPNDAGQHGDETVSENVSDTETKGYLADRSQAAASGEPRQNSYNEEEGLVREMDKRPDNVQNTRNVQPPDIVVDSPGLSIPGALPSVEAQSTHEALSETSARDLFGFGPQPAENSETDQLKAKLAELQASHKDLQGELEHQRNITEQVRQEASLFLEEMRQLTHRTQHSETAEKLAQEASQWQARYEQVRKELDEMRRANRMSRLPSMADYMVLEIDPSVLRDDGEISEKSVRNFHDSISSLLSGVRSQPGQWPELLHRVVLAARELGEESSGASISRTANQLITVVRNYAQVKGLMSLAVVDAAAADLTMAVAEQIQERGVFRRAAPQLPAILSKAPPTAQTPSPPPHVHTGDRSPPQRALPKLPPVEIPADSTISELQTYLEEQTSETVDAISGLLSGIRDNSNAGELRDKAETIERAAAKMLSATGSSMSQTHNWLLKDKGSFLLESLSDCQDRMQTLNQELWRHAPESRPSRHLRQRLAGVSFDMAKATKELVKTVEEVSLKQELNHLDSQSAPTEAA